MNLLIRGGRVVDPSQSLNSPRDIWVVNGRIQELLAPGSSAPQKPEKIIEAEGFCVVPGFVDMHVHLREPGETEKEDIESGSKAAVSGGFTSILCMPNTNPPNDSPKITQQILEKASEVNLCRIYPVGAITKALRGKEITDMSALQKAGCIAFSDDGKPVNDPQVMRQALTQTRDLGCLLIEHCEELELTQGGENSCAIETIDANRALMLAVELKAKLHIAHISCGATVDLVEKYKKAWSGITAEVTPHHLSLTNDAVSRLGTQAKMYPPLRPTKDRDRLRKGVSEGLIDVIATDHAPHTQKEKSKPFSEAPNGVIGLETAFPLLMTLVHKGVFTLDQLVRVLSCRPAEILGLPCGKLEPNRPADLTIFDPNIKRKLTEKDLRSKSRNTPFMGLEVFGKVIYTLVGGVPKFVEAA